MGNGIEHRWTSHASSFVLHENSETSSFHIFNVSRELVHFDTLDSVVDDNVIEAIEDDATFATLPGNVNHILMVSNTAAQTFKDDTIRCAR